MSGNPALTYTTNVIFRCPDFPSLHDKGKGYRFIFIGPEGTWLTIVAINGGDRFRMSIVGTPDKVNHSEADIRAALRRAMGKDFDYEILSVMRWVRRELVADRYGTDRVFLAGDSVHLISPTGALGMNTGMQDAVDLGWKLDAVIRGWGGPHLLESYEIERKPVAVRNVKASTENLERMLAPRTTHKPPPEVFQAGPGGRRRAQGLWRLVHRADEPRVVHERLPSRLPLRRLADRRGRTARRRRRSRARPIPRPRGRARARRMSGCRTGARRSISSAAVLCCCGSAPMRPTGEGLQQAAAERRRAARGRRARRSRRCSRPTSGGWCWCGRMAMSPGAPMPSRATPAPSSTGARRAADRARRRGRTLRLHRELRQSRRKERYVMKHDPQHAPYLFRARAHELFARLGAARAVDVGGAETEIQAGGVALRRRQARARRLAQLVPAEQTERRNLIMVNPIEGNNLRHDPQSGGRLSMRAWPATWRARTGIPPPRCGSCCRPSPAPTRWSNGARVDMAPGDVVLTPAWSWHGHVNESDETSYWIDFLDIPFVQLTEAMFFEPYPQGGLEPVISDGATPMRIPSGDALGPGRDAKVVEIGKDVMPTIGLHLMRQPAGGRVDVAKSTTNNIYAVISGHAALHVAGGFSETLGPGDVIAVPCWHAHTIEAPDDSTIFRVTDEPILEKLGLMKTATA